MTVVFLLTFLASVLPALAQSAGGQVVLRESPQLSEQGDAVVTRIRSELETEGLEVVERGDGEGDDAPLATIRVTDADRGVRVDLTLARGPTGSAERRAFYAQDNEHRTVALRVAEYVRASGIDVATRRRSAAERSVPPGKPRARAELGVLLLGGVAGERLPIGPAVALGVRFFEDFWAEGRLASFVRTRVTQAESSTSLTHTLAMAGVRWTLLDRPLPSLFVAAGAGVYRLDASGTTQGADLNARDDASTLPAAVIGGGVAARLMGAANLTLVLRADALLPAARTEVRHARQVVDVNAKLLVLGSLGFEASF